MTDNGIPPHVSEMFTAALEDTKDRNTRFNRHAVLEFVWDTAQYVAGHNGIYVHYASTVDPRNPRSVAVMFQKDGDAEIQSSTVWLEFNGSTVRLQWSIHGDGVRSEGESLFSMPVRDSEVARQVFYLFDLSRGIS